MGVQRGEGPSGGYKGEKVHHGGTKGRRSIMGYRGEKVHHGVQRGEGPSGCTHIYIFAHMTA